MDPLSLVMFGLIAVLIFFMFRNGKKRQQAQQEMQNNLRPGAEVMLQSGIYGTVESVDEEENRVTVRSGDASFVVHRNAVGQILTPASDSVENSSVAPDDDPEFGEHFNGTPESTDELPDVDTIDESDPRAGESNSNDGDVPKN